MPTADVPATVKRVMVPDHFHGYPRPATILTPDTTFDDTIPDRGFPRLSAWMPLLQCRICVPPPPFPPLDLLDRQVDEGCALTDRIGLVGAAVSDLPGIRELCGKDRGRDIHFGFSSLRADALDGPLIEALKKKPHQNRHHCTGCR